MNVVVRQLRHPLRLLFAALLLLTLPFIGMAPRVAATDMPAMSADMQTDCATACARAATAPPTQAIFEREERQTPDPAPQTTTPYYMQYSKMYVSKVLRPTAEYRSSQSRPPDIVKLSGNFRF